MVVAHIKELPKGQGFDAVQGKYVDMVKAGIVDPTKVCRAALENATSIAGMVLSTEAAVADKPEEKKAAAAWRPGHSHGMPPY